MSEVASQSGAGWKTIDVPVSELEWSRATGLRPKSITRDPMTGAAGVNADDRAAPVYHEGGAGELLLLLPPPWVEARCYALLASELSRHHRLIIWEPRGRPSGRQPTSSVPSVPQHCRDILDILDAEGVDTFHVIAWCWGAQVAAALVKEGSPRVRSIALLSPDIYVENADEYSRLLNLDGHPHGFGCHLEECSAPILLLLGTHDRLTDYISVREHCGAFQQLTIATILGGTHYLLVEQSPTVARLLTAFVRHDTIDADRTPAAQCDRVVIESHAQTSDGGARRPRRTEMTASAIAEPARSAVQPRLDFRVLERLADIYQDLGLPPPVGRMLTPSALPRECRRLLVHRRGMTRKPVKGSCPSLR